jgi:hypothetical protein
MKKVSRVHPNFFQEIFEVRVHVTTPVMFLESGGDAGTAAAVPASIYNFRAIVTWRESSDR